MVLPEKWRRRKYAGTEVERDAAQLRQLEKAQKFLATARGAHKGGLLYDA